MVSENTMLDNLIEGILGGADAGNLLDGFCRVKAEHEAHGDDGRIFERAVGQRLLKLNDWNSHERGVREWPARRSELLAQWKTGGDAGRQLAAMLETYTVVPSEEQIEAAEETLRESWTTVPPQKPASWLERILHSRLALPKGRNT